MKQMKKIPANESKPQKILLNMNLTPFPQIVTGPPLTASETSLCHHNYTDMKMPQNAVTC